MIKVQRDISAIEREVSFLMVLTFQQYKAYISSSVFIYAQYLASLSDKYFENLITKYSLLSQLKIRDEMYFNVKM